MVHGFAYFQMLTEELPDLVKHYFPADLEKQMIAGVMEGGYSAFYAALSCPGKYCFAACYSCGSLSDEAFEGREKKQMEDAFGEAGAFDLKSLLSDEKRDHGELKLSLVYAAGDRYKKSADLLAAAAGHQVEVLLRDQRDPLGWSEWVQQLKVDLEKIL